MRNRWPAVVTIHDLLYFRNAAIQIREYSRLDGLYMTTFIPRSVRSAKRVVAVSDWTAVEAERMLRVPREKVKVIHHAASTIFEALPEEGLERIKRRYGLGRPFFLYVGSLSARKNVRRLVEAFGRVRKRLPHDLVVTGAGEVPEIALRDLIDRYEMGERFIRLGLIPQQDLVALYNLAEALVFPSLYEGFGMPPLEAFACSCPVISSAVAGLGEVVGDAALVIDPYDVEGRGQAIEAVARDGELRRRLVAKGRRRLQRFSWKKSARQLLETLEVAAGSE